MSKLKNRNRGGKKAQRTRSRNRSLQIKNRLVKQRTQFMSMLQQAQEEAKRKSLEDAQKEQEKNVVESTDIGDIGDTSEFQL